VFQRIQWMWRCYPKVDLFTSKKNRLTKTCNSKKRFKQHRKWLKAGLFKHKRPHFLHPPIFLLLKVLRKFQEEGKIAILIAPSWKGQIWVDLLKKLTISTIPS
jgi:hypothetical protein